MQVAKYWRNNQLRYRLQGVVQQKVNVTFEAKTIEDSDNKLQKSQDTTLKIKVA
jgi:hypothetical protein